METGLGRRRGAVQAGGVGLALILLCGVPLWGQAAGELAAAAADAEFAAELTGILAREGWTARETMALREGLREMAQAEAGRPEPSMAGADPRLVALALQSVRHDRHELSGPEQAMLALEVARLAREMEALGYEEPAIARTALNGVRRVVGERSARGAEGEAGEWRNLLRSRLRQQLRSALHEQNRAAAQTRRRGRAGGFTGGPGGFGGGAGRLCR